MKGTWLSDKLGVSVFNKVSDHDLKGSLMLVQLSLTVMFNSAEIIFTIAINLDFIWTVFNSFNRKDNIRKIKALVYICSLFCLVSLISILIEFVQDINDDEHNTWVEEVGVQNSYGLRQVVNIWIRHIIWPVQILFLGSCVLVFFVAIYKLILTRQIQNQQVHQVLMRQIQYGFILLIVEMPFNVVLIHTTWDLFSNNYDEKYTWNEPLVKIVYALYMSRGLVIALLRFLEPAIYNDLLVKK